MNKDVVVVWFDLKDVDKILRMPDFIPCSEYESLATVTPYEYGRVEYDRLTVVYRCSSFEGILKCLWGSG